MSTWWGRLPIQRKYWATVACAGAGIALLGALLAWIRTGAILVDWQRDHSAVDAAAVAALGGALALQLWLIGAVCMAAAAMVGWWVSRTLARPIESLARALDAGTSPAQALAPHCEDEIAQIAFATHMVDGQGAPGGDVMAAGRRLVATIRATMQDASRSTGGGDEFRAQIEQVATAIEEMSATIVSVAQSTSEAHGNADDACRTAREGGERVGKAIDGMRKIHARVNDIAQTIRTLGASSEKIGEIVDVIYDIADQTNLLALNAAIEAARVGEQGRGFAVVADEVRKLAERTTKATKEIAEVIKKIQADTSAAVSAMDEGTAAVAEEMEVARQAGDALMRIVEKIELVTDKVQHIAAATEQQSATANAVASNMEQAARLSRETNEWTVRALGQIQQIDRCAHEFESAIEPAEDGARKPSLRLVNRAA